MSKLVIGKEEQSIIDLLIMQRHMACFGASGSGKTVASKVIVEELVRQKVPVIAFDPQGDIASLVNPEEFNPETETPEFIYKEYQENAEVLIWTPGSSKGIPLCINPLKFDEAVNMDNEDRLRYLGSIAKNIVGLIGFDTDSDDGRTAESVLSLNFEYCLKNGISLSGFEQLIDLMLDMPDSVKEAVASVCSKKLLEQITKKLKLLTLGSRQLIFDNGFTADIETLLGLNEPDNGKTRVSVIYLNTLHSQEEKEFFVGAICQMLYSWMLKNPLTSGQDGLQCALYIDEIAPYLPPVKKPACKQSLTLLLKQARKYGVGCLLATQNPGDVDYKSLAQVQSYLIGRLTTKQDLQKVKNRLDSIAPDQADDILEKLPALKQGNFIMLAPDAFSKAVNINIRWLVSNHSVLTEDQLKQYVPEKFMYKKEDLNDNETTLIEEAVVNTEELNHQQPVVIVPGKNQVQVLKLNLPGVEAKQKVKSMLEGGLFGKKEEVAECNDKYAALFRIKLNYLKKGTFSSKLKPIPTELFVEAKSKKIVYAEGKNFRLEPENIADPRKIKSFELTEEDIELKEFDNAKMPKINADKLYKEIKEFLEKEFKVECLNYDVYMLPIWELVIKKRKGPGIRKIIFEAFSSKQIFF